MGVRSALITGATGFVGRNLAGTLLEHGWRVQAIVRPGRQLPRILTSVGVETATLSDLAELPSILDRAESSAVFHLAAHQSKGHGPSDIDAFVEANLRLGLHLFSAAAERGMRVINALTYFQFRGGIPSAHSLYSATKQAQADFASFWRERLGADIRDVVLFDNYGPHDGRDKLIPGLLRAAHSGVPLRIGPLKQPMDLLHVRDVATGLLAAAEGTYVGPVAVRADHPVNVGAVIDAVGVAAGRKVPVVVDPAREVNNHPIQAGSWPSPDGWVPKVNLSDGLAECIAAAR